MKRVWTILVTFGTGGIGLTFSHLWGRYYPFGSGADPTHISVQAQAIQTLGIAGLVTVGTFLGLAVGGIVYSKGPPSSRSLTALSRLVIVWSCLSMLFGVSLLLNLIVKPEPLKELPLAIWSIRTALSIQWAFIALSVLWVLIHFLRERRL